MANAHHVRLIRQGVASWNRWREDASPTRPNLAHARLSGVDLTRANLAGALLLDAELEGANLAGARLSGADLRRANLRGADLTRANLDRANCTRAYLRKARLPSANLQEALLTECNLTEAGLQDANLTRANLREAIAIRADMSGARLVHANLIGANLTRANLTQADFTRANLSMATLVGAQFGLAILIDCQVYGASAWDLKLAGAVQRNLRITPASQPDIMVDDLEVAQFLYLLLNNKKLRDVIDTIGRKVVLILGRFTPERKVVLDAIRSGLRHYGYVPVMFDFEPPLTRNLTQTVVTLAHLSRFIIADITDPRSIPQELEAIVPRLTRVPVQPIIEDSQAEWGMFADFKEYPWVLDVLRYDDVPSLLASLKESLVEPAERRALELSKK